MMIVGRFFSNTKEVRINTNIKKSLYQHFMITSIDRSIDHCAARFDLKIDTDQFKPVIVCCLI